MAPASEDYRCQAVLITVSLVILSGISTNQLAQGAVPCGNILINPVSSLCCQGLVYVRSGFQPACCGKRGFDARYYLCCNLHLRRKVGRDPRCCGNDVYDALTQTCHDTNAFRDTKALVSRTALGSTCCKTDMGWKCCNLREGCCDSSGSGSVVEIPGFRPACCQVLSIHMKAQCCFGVLQRTGVMSACCISERVRPVCCQIPGSVGNYDCCPRTSGIPRCCQHTQNYWQPGTHPGQTQRSPGGPRFISRDRDKHKGTPWEREAFGNRPTIPTRRTDTQERILPTVNQASRGTCCASSHPRRSCCKNRSRGQGQDVSRYNPVTCCGTFSSKRTFEHCCHNGFKRTARLPRCCARTSPQYMSFSSRAPRTHHGPTTARSFTTGMVRQFSSWSKFPSPPTTTAPVSSVCCHHFPSEAFYHRCCAAAYYRLGRLSPCCRPSPQTTAAGVFRGDAVTAHRGNISYDNSISKSTHRPHTGILTDKDIKVEVFQPSYNTARYVPSYRTREINHRTRAPPRRSRAPEWTTRKSGPGVVLNEHTTQPLPKWTPRRNERQHNLHTRHVTPLHETTPFPVTPLSVDRSRETDEREEVRGSERLSVQCGDKAFDPNEQICCLSVVRPRVGRRSACCVTMVFDTEQYKCCDGQIKYDCADDSAVIVM